jgi:hypothetical protein
MCTKKVYKIPVQITKPTLTLEAFGVAVKLLTLPTKEKLNITNMSKAMGITRSTMYVYLYELDEANVLKPVIMGRDVIYEFTPPETWGQLTTNNIEDRKVTE